MIDRRTHVIHDDLMIMGVGGRHMLPEIFEVLFTWLENLNHVISR